LKFLLAPPLDFSPHAKLSFRIRVPRKVPLALPFTMKLRVLLSSGLALLSAGSGFAAAAPAPAAAAPAPAAAAPAPAAAAAAAAPTTGPVAELKVLVERIQNKLKAGIDSPVSLADELKAFDQLFAKYRSQKTEEVAVILFMQARLYLEVFENNEKALELFKQLKTEFPLTEVGMEADKVIAGLEANLKAAKIRESLPGQPAPEIKFTWSSRDDLKTLSALKGKVVILDFWATWCGPCVASFPDMRELVAHYKDRDVVVVGVTSLQGAIVGLTKDPIDTKDNPAKEYALMKDYIKAKDLTWSVVFSEADVFNPDYGVTGIPYLAIIAPDGKVRHTGLHPGIPAEEKYKMIDAILKEFGKKLPLASEPNK
jgi:thiol-disulfide isomerase/thioredoxin